MAAKAKPVDWVAVEADYRAGVLTDRAIGKAHGLSHGAIQKRAKRDGWTRDLSKRIEKRRDDKVARAAVAKQGSQLSPATEKQVVEANADLQSSLILSHRKDVGAAREIVNAMFAELGILGDPKVQEGLRLLAMGEAAKDGGAEAMKSMLKAVDAAVALPGRALVVQKLTASLASLIDKERQAFGIDKAGEGNQSLGEFLESLK